jgi:hypothetical protein
MGSRRPFTPPTGEYPSLLLALSPSLCLSLSLCLALSLSLCLALSVSLCLSLSLSLVTSPRVMTVSFHKFGEYFPGTGDVKDKGYGPGEGYAINCPLHDGMDDESYRSPLLSSFGLPHRSFQHNLSPNYWEGDGEIPTHRDPPSVRRRQPVRSGCSSLDLS